MTGNFDEALVQRQVVSNGVLPALLVVAVVRKILYKKSTLEPFSLQILNFGFDFHFYCRLSEINRP